MFLFQNRPPLPIQRRAPRTANQNFVFRRTSFVNLRARNVIPFRNEMANECTMEYIEETRSLCQSGNVTNLVNSIEKYAAAPSGMFSANPSCNSNLRYPDSSPPPGRSSIFHRNDKAGELRRAHLILVAVNQPAIRRGGGGGGGSGSIFDGDTITPRMPPP